jgi:4-hydroxy-tetrahydrodipicolinate synthase
MLACLEAACRHRGLLERMLPAPMASLDEPTARRVVHAIDEAGFLPEPAAVEGVSA